MMTEPRKQVETVLASPEFLARLAHTARLDVGSDPEAARDLGQQLAFEVCRAADKRLDRLNNPEAFIWACYKFAKRDFLRKRERLARRLAAQ